MNVGSKMAIKTGSLLSKSVRKFPLAWKNRMRLPIPAGWGMIVLNSITVTALVLGARQLGWLQPSELAAYDLMVRLRPDQVPDPRLVIVTITEADIKIMQQWPRTDQVVAQLLANLQRHHPRAIGLDLFRNISHPPGTKELAAEFKKNNFIAISYIGNSEDETIAPPPGIPEERIGFSDILTDPDGAVRRNLFFARDGKKDALSFSFQLALIYLDAEKI
jgi:adenylate cyclase